MGKCAIIRLAACAAVAGLAVGCCSVVKPGYDTLIAHRGESVDAPENTLPAYKTAVERGFGFECDIYLSNATPKNALFITFNEATCKALKARGEQNGVPTEIIPQDELRRREPNVSPRSPDARRPFVFDDCRPLMPLPVDGGCL